jgi:hypothetical protein
VISNWKRNKDIKSNSNFKEIKKGERPENVNGEFFRIKKKILMGFKIIEPEKSKRTMEIENEHCKLDSQICLRINSIKGLSDEEDERNYNGVEIKLGTELLNFENGSYEKQVIWAHKLGFNGGNIIFLIFKYDTKVVAKDALLKKYNAESCPLLVN